MKTGIALPSIFWLAAAVCTAQSLTIRLYDYAGLTAEETARATGVAGLAFEHAGIELNWIYCRGSLAPSDIPDCLGNMAANEITLRLHPREPNPARSRKGELAYALVTAAGGHYSTVYVPAVRAVAADLEIAFDLLLGYAIAHETGHCLLGPRHSAAGLMRAAWTRQDAREIEQQRLGLSKQEARRAVARLARGATPATEISEYGQTSKVGRRRGLNERMSAAAKTCGLRHLRSPSTSHHDLVRDW